MEIIITMIVWIWNDSSEYPIDTWQEKSKNNKLQNLIKLQKFILSIAFYIN